MKLQKLQVTLEPYALFSDAQGKALMIDVEVGGQETLHIKRIVPDNDFESYFDYVWNACKELIDAEINNLEEEER